MRSLVLILFYLCISMVTIGQVKAERPRLVVGIMVDQMRWDYLYKYANRYGNDGFRRMLREGFTCENTYIPYAQTVTACGHASVYTGSVPSINGIMGNDWWDKQQGRLVYCVEDESVKVLEGGPKAEPMSPRNLSVTTMCDELRIATNFKAKVIGIAIKDRGGILPAGHSANAAYWYDGANGNWVSSTYYMDDLPSWVKGFNSRKVTDSLLKLNWNTLYPINTYKMSDPDDKEYEGKNHVFPHITSDQVGKNYGALAGTPHGNTLTLQFAKEALLAEQMGEDGVTDFLAVSLSSPDYIGHAYGPNSIEVEDNYLRLDRELGEFFRFLDKKFGGEYTVFLTADHAVAHAQGFSRERKLPGGAFVPNTSNAYKNILERVNDLKGAKSKFTIQNLIENFSNYQIYLNRKAIDSAKLNVEEVKQIIIQELNKEPGIHYAYDNEKIMEAQLPSEVKEKFMNGLHPKLGGDIQVILKSGYYPWEGTGATHGAWYPYDSHIPFVLMGWGIKQGVLYRNVNMSDIAPTICSLLRIQMPSGNVGNAVGEAIR